MSTGFELQQAALESVRFGIRVERARSTAGAATSPLLEQIRRSSADLIILRTEAGHSELATALQQQGEFVIHADTPSLLRYHAGSRRRRRRFQCPASDHSRPTGDCRHRRSQLPGLSLALFGQPAAAG